MGQRYSVKHPQSVIGASLTIALSNSGHTHRGRKDAIGRYRIEWRFDQNASPRTIRSGEEGAVQPRTDPHIRPIWVTSTARLVPGSHARPGFVEIKTPRAGAMARKAGYENDIQKSVEYADTWRALMN